MSLRGEPQSIPEHIRRIYEILRGLGSTVAPHTHEDTSTDTDSTTTVSDEYVEQSWTFPEGATVGAGLARWYPPFQFWEVDSVRASADTAPTGASLIVDVNKNGTTIYTDQANRPTIAASTNTALGGTPDTSAGVSGDYYTPDIDQVGSTIPGSWVIVTMRIKILEA